MGDIKAPNPTLLIIAAFSRETAPSEETGPTAWARRRCEERFGPIRLESEAFQVDLFTDYYAPSMGTGLLKRFWAFERPIDPGTLAGIKCFSNALESEYAASHGGDVERPLNLDPGYIDLGKLVLASTKDHAHRIYLRDGIYAETTLMYTRKHWQPHPWTYPDYQSGEFQRFFDRCRAYLKTLRAASSGC
ncbi:MAG TPA: DUF4416 domain-containing protein [Planctomycetaceae bacterium]|nr:DUF4416 domain-containing protein [Planctomycetaceae bacterium]